jgi:hypothetical protein
LGCRAKGIAALYVAGEYRPIDVFRHYESGRNLFKQLAERAGEFLLGLPAEIVNVYPPDWKPFETYLKTYRILREEPPTTASDMSSAAVFSTYDAILPPGSSWSERWASYLHWLGWRGETPGISAKRQSWAGNTIFPWPSDATDHDKLRGLGPFQFLPVFVDCRHFFSVIENVFLSSALALDYIESQLSQEAPRKHKYSAPATTALLPSTSSDANAAIHAMTPQEAAPSPRPARTKLFVSYSHSDAKWLKRFQVHLAPLERDSMLDRWDDTRIRTGQNWKDEIRQAIDSAKVAVLLISADFLASDFIAKNELPPLLAAARNEGAIIMPVIVGTCRFAETESLARFQAVNPPSRPLAELRPAHRERFWVQLTKDIEKALSGNPKAQ